MSIITPGPILAVTEYFRAVTVEDRYYPRINEVLSQQLIAPAYLDDAAAIAAALADGPSVAGGFGTRAEYRVISRGEGEDYFACQVHGFDRSPEETVVNVDLKIPLADLPAGFDSLTQAEQEAAVIDWGQNVARSINFDDY